MTDGAPAPAEGEVLSIYEAAERLGRPKEPAPTNSGDDVAAQRAPADPEPSGDDPEAAAATEPPGETTEADDAASEPPVDPPRHWRKAEKELFATLPRENQLALIENERARDREIQKGIQANTEREKALEAERQAAEKARQQYEAALPQITQLLAAQHQSEFADIKTLADAEKLLQANPSRYMKWELSQKKVAAAQAEASQLAQARQAEAAKWYDQFVRTEDARFIEAAPEYGDPAKAEKLQLAAVETLTEIGFSEDELTALMKGQRPLHARDHRVQLLVRDATRWRQAQKAAATAKARTVPPVTRPGTAPDKGAAKVQALQEAQKQLARTGRTEDAVALLRAKRAS